MWNRYSKKASFKFYMLIKKTIVVYKEIYNLPELVYKEQVSDDFLQFYKKVHYFVIISVYNTKKEILLIRDFNKNVGWEIPGNNIDENESIENAIHKVAVKEIGLEIDELEPIAIVKNFFICGEKMILHTGIAFIASSRGGGILKFPSNIQSLFTNKVKIKTAYQNDKIIDLALERIKTKKNEPPYEEIESVSSKKFISLYNIHKYFIKLIGNISSRKIKKEIFKTISGKPKSILDVSCGDSELISTLCKKYKPEICVGNDISWKSISLIKNKNPDVVFTNHNILNLPYKKVFDLVIFKNTLHHIDKEYQVRVINDLKNISKQLIIIDVDDPQNSSVLSKIWNIYYRYFLGDQGDSFLNFLNFKKIIEEKIKNIKYKTEIIKTIKGSYFFASIIKQD